LKYVPPKKGAPSGVRKNGERQPPAAGQHLVRELIVLVEIRALLAVHLDVDEQAISPRPPPGLEGLVAHHVAQWHAEYPTERRTACPPSRARLSASSPQACQSTDSRVLLEIGTGFPCEAIGMTGDCWEFRQV